VFVVLVVCGLWRGFLYRIFWQTYDSTRVELTRLNSTQLNSTQLNSTQLDSSFDSNNRKSESPRAGAIDPAHVIWGGGKSHTFFVFFARVFSQCGCGHRKQSQQFDPSSRSSSFICLVFFHIQGIIDLKGTMTTTRKQDIYRILVIGLNRPRLTHIMAMVEEEQKQQESSETALPFAVEFLPCVAKMDYYESEEGKVRYMISLNFHDGSAMTQFLDDPDTRSSLTAVVMIGYEWMEDSDKPQLENYFEANNARHLEMECVQANSKFDNLQEEMEFFKSLSEEEKAKHVTEQTMGPGKMCKFVLNMADHIKEEKLLELQPEAETQEENMADEAKLSRQPPDPAKPRFACRMCRIVLFGQDDLQDDHTQNLHSFRKANYQQNRPTVACQSLFCKESVLEWLSPNGQHIEGKLSCPKCSSKIGHWKWVGTQCSCGTWVTPAIQIPISKVDTLKPITNVTAPMSVVADDSL
jgi:dual specificity phosphatase 12